MYKTRRPTYVLHYFNARARAETIRLIFAAAEIEYEDARFESSEWPANLKHKLPFGRVPVLEVNGEYLDQSPAIAKYLAREAGLAGRNPIEAFRVEAVGETINEIRETAIPCMFVKDEEEKKQKIEEYITTTTKVLENLEAYLKKNRGGNAYLVGDQLTWVDLHLVAVNDFVSSVFPNALKDFPKLAALEKKVKNMPKIAAWYMKRPKTQF